MMRVVFSLVGRLTSWAIRIAGLWHPKARQIVQGRGQTLSRLRQHLDAGRQTVWFHASSLGEFEQGRPLMEEIRRQHPDYQIVLSFFSPSGYNVRHAYEGADVVVYLPEDTRSAVRAFLDLVRPRLAFFIKYDFWPSMLSELSARGVKTYLVSAIFRPSQLFFRPWGGWYLNLLKSFAHIFVQDEASRRLLQDHGISSLSVVGDTRFDRVVSIAASATPIAQIESMISDATTLLVAGSSWPRDEEMLVRYFNAHPSLRLVLAPHEIDEEHLLYIESLLTRPYKRLSALTSKGASTDEDYDCLIIDSFGLLSSAYRYADMAYVGGGFGKSIHNTIEAAVYGIPVLFGPKIEKFREAQDLVQSGGGVMVGSEAELVQHLEQLSRDAKHRASVGEASRAYVASQIGATNAILSTLNLA